VEAGIVTHEALHTYIERSYCTRGVVQAELPILVTSRVDSGDVTDSYSMADAQAVLHSYTSTSILCDQDASPPGRWQDCPELLL
jgi:hypothetical protein